MLLRKFLLAALPLSLEALDNVDSASSADVLLGGHVVFVIVIGVDNKGKACRVTRQ